MGWLSSRDKDHKQSRYDYYKEKEDNSNGSSPLLTMPPITPGGDLYINLLNKIGPAKSQPMGGLTSISYTDIYYYVELLDIELEPYDFRLIKKLSQAYASEYNLSLDKNTAPPYNYEEIINDMRLKVQKQFQQFVRMHNATFQSKRR